MALSLQNFIGSIGKSGGVSRKHDYQVQFLKAGASIDLTLRCESFSLPGQNIETSVDNIRVGPIRDHAIGVNYGSVTGVFLCSRFLPEKIFFDDWQQEIFSTEFNMAYYKDYVKDITVEQMDGGLHTYGVKLIDAYPKSISAMDLSSGSNELQRVSVEFAYYRWVPYGVNAS